MLCRNPIAAGKFYALDAKHLYNELDRYFNNLSKDKGSIVQPEGLIVPHAGYVYSGQTAAEGYWHLDKDFKPESVFLIGPSHHYGFNGGGLYQGDYFATPLGNVAVNKSVNALLVNENELFQYHNKAHEPEHCLEVQLPFLQYIWGNRFNLVPILIGTQNVTALKQMAKTLAPYFKKPNLFVISSDFTHYPNYDDAHLIDHAMATAIESGLVEKLDETVSYFERLQIKGLSTCACGLQAIKLLMFIVNEFNHGKIERISYSNSGDSVYGEKDRVVGYWAFKATSGAQNEAESGFSKEEQDWLLRRARNAIKAYLNDESAKAELSKRPDAEKLHQTLGLFVSVYVNHKLRGCIGRFEPDIPLYKLVNELAVAASQNDHRFKPVSAHELDDLTIELSVLSALEKVNSLNEIEIGRHGIVVEHGSKRGTLLPQVAPANGWDKDEFFNYCAMHKAGLTEKELQTASIYRYSAFIISEKI